jgi:hypothetical protein
MQDFGLGARQQSVAGGLLHYQEKNLGNAAPTRNGKLGAAEPGAAGLRAHWNWGD